MTSTFFSLILSVLGMGLILIQQADKVLNLGDDEHEYQV